MSISSPSKVEPDLREDYSTEALANAYNWYNYWQDSAKAKDYTINYLKEIEFSKEKIAAVKRIPENQFINSIGWNARILTLGGSLPDGYQDRMMLKLEKLISSDEPVSADDEIEAETEKVVSVQDRTKEKISNYIALLETELDNNYKDRDYTFNMYEWLSKNEIKPLVARAIADYFIPTYNELIDVLGDGDADLKEGYDHLDKADKIKTLKFLQGIVDDAETFAANVKKATRKPRTPKPKSAEKLAAKVKYKESDDKYKIKSVRPMTLSVPTNFGYSIRKPAISASISLLDPQDCPLKGQRFLAMTKTNLSRRNCVNQKSILVLFHKEQNPNSKRSWTISQQNQKHLTAVSTRILSYSG